ncbi:hypothetical protein D9M70_545650 [compost metagenome]
MHRLAARGFGERQRQQREAAETLGMLAAHLGCVLVAGPRQAAGLGHAAAQVGARGGQRGDRPLDAVDVHHLQGFFRRPLRQRRPGMQLQAVTVDGLGVDRRDDVVVNVDTSLLDAHCCYASQMSPEGDRT